MYMVPAANRLEALIGMNGKFELKDTVNTVAHSQGCLLSALAQAFLMELLVAIMSGSVGENSARFY